VIRKTGITVLRLARSNQAKFAIVFLVINLHTFRHLALIPYLALYLAVALFVTVQFVKKLLKVRESERDAVKWIPLGVFLAVALLGTITSFAFISPAGALYGAGRFVFALPLLFAFFLYTDSWSTLRGHLVTFVVFFALASLTIPLQLVTGPVSWFAAASERAGLDRYSSLVGSLTAVGIIAGCFLVLIQATKPVLRMILALVIVVSVAVSLSKAGIANLAIAAIVLMFLNRKSHVKLLLTASIALMVAVAGYVGIPPLRDRLNASLVSFGVATDSVVNFDQTLLDGALDRLVYWPSMNFAGLADIGNPLVYIFGGGFGMADTALVPASDSLAPMAHNQFAEAITVFGFLGGGLLIAAMLLILYRLLQLYRIRPVVEAQLIIWTYILFLFNSIFANGTLYQPAGASIFYLGMFLAMFGKSLITAQSGNGGDTSLVPAARPEARVALTSEGPQNDL
jgi:hypothetical protein